MSERDLIRGQQVATRAWKYVCKLYRRLYCRFFLRTVAIIVNCPPMQLKQRDVPHLCYEIGFSDRTNLPSIILWFCVSVESPRLRGIRQVDIVNHHYKAWHNVPKQTFFRLILPIANKRDVFIAEFLLKRKEVPVVFFPMVRAKSLLDEN